MVLRFARSSGCRTEAPWPRGRPWLLLVATPILWGTWELGFSDRANARGSLSAGLDEGATSACHESDVARVEALPEPAEPALTEPANETVDSPEPSAALELLAPGTPSSLPLPDLAEVAVRLEVALPEPGSSAVECEPTPLTAEALAEALREGHVRRFGMAPHADRWACAWAQCAFEQARGDAIYAFNIGHVTAPGDSGQVCRRRFRERITRNPDRWEMRDVWFRVFDSPAAGAAAYWRLLTDSYYSVLTRCDSADARGAARRLAELGYFTGPEEPYVEGMASLFVHARGALIPRIVATQDTKIIK